jgi:hypothetical protein
MQKSGFRALGVPWTALVGLALLGLPRVLLHDLNVIQEGDLANLLLVVVPPAVWIVVVLSARVPKPFLTLIVVGAIYGVFLAVGHQLLWDHALGKEPSLGGNLEGQLSPAVEELVIRIFAFISSLFTGLLVGAVTGLVAWGAGRLLNGRTAVR